MVNIRKQLANNIRSMRGEQTQSAYAGKIGIDQGSLNRIEQGQQNVTIDTLQKICERLKCTPSDLLE